MGGAAEADALRHGRERAFHEANVRRFRRAADEQESLARFCRMTPRWAHAAPDHDAAAERLRDAAATLELHNRWPAP